MSSVSDDRRARQRVALEAIAAVSGKSVDGLRPEQDLVADLGIESPQALRLLVELEEALGLEISDEAAAAMETVGDVLDHVDKAGSG